jgi:dGTPase
MQLEMYTKQDRARIQKIKPTHNLPHEAYRSSYRRDISRLVHAPSFRRLQGKTQLFPGHESDFFRNRLTHSLEVAQIAESIGYKLNSDIKKMEVKYANCKINIDILRFAGLAHDLGHPPFGHLGEQVLNCQMAKFGGFEGNAQTLHILTKLEKVAVKGNRLDSVEDNQDYRLGLNLTYRSLASILKYDNCIRVDSNKSVKNGAKTMHPEKGYYESEEDVVKLIKEHVAPGFKGKFKTVECAIMDVADDIAYSTYDLEDALKAGFISSLSVAATTEDTWNIIVPTVNQNLAKEHKSLGYSTPPPTINKEEAIEFVKDLFDDYLLDKEKIKGSDDKFKLIQDAFATSQLLLNDGRFRTGLTSYLVGRFIRNVKIEINDNYPALSKVYLDVKERKSVEILKQLTWQYQILNHRLKIVASRGIEIVKTIFEVLTNASEDEELGEPGFELLPNDFKDIYDQFEDKELKKRVVCDFVAGMTDRYAIEFYGRLKSMNPETIFKPL